MRKKDARRRKGVGVEFQRGNIWDHRKRLLTQRCKNEGEQEKGNNNQLEERKIWGTPQQVEGYLEGWRREMMGS